MKEDLKKINDEVYTMTAVRVKIENIELLESFVDVQQENLLAVNNLVDNKMSKSKNDYYKDVYTKLNNALDAIIKDNIKMSKLSGHAVLNYKELAYEVEELKRILREEKDSLKEANLIYKNASRLVKKPTDKEMKVHLINSAKTKEEKEILIKLWT